MIWASPHRYALGLLLVFATLQFVSLRQGFAEVTYEPDIDLKTAPEFYRNRVIRFRTLLRKEKTKDAKIDRAVALANDPNSPYRKDAISFLGEIRSRKAAPHLRKLTSDPDVGDFALHALGDIPDAQSIPTLISHLDSDNDKLRGNAYRSLEILCRRKFNFDYSASKETRAAQIREIKTWWENNRKGFKVTEESPKEQKAAEEAWQKYGLEYVRDLSR